MKIKKMKVIHHLVKSLFELNLKQVYDYDYNTNLISKKKMTKYE